MTDRTNGSNRKSTVVRLLLATGVIALLALAVGLFAARHGQSRQNGRDRTAIALADKVAAALQRYAGHHGGAYPGGITGYWPNIVEHLGPESEWPVKPAPVIFKAWAGDEGDNIHGYSNEKGSIYQLIFLAAGGTGKLYCRDPKGMTVISPVLLKAPGPWAGCPSTRIASPEENDKAAIALADKVAAALQRYAGHHGGAYPGGITGYWPNIVEHLGPESEWPVKPAPVIFKAWAGDEGDNIHGYSNEKGSIYQLIFLAAGGTGKLYCRDPKGMTVVRPALLKAPGPWDGCP